MQHTMPLNTNTLGYSTLHYTTLHYTTLHYTSKRRYFHTLSLRTFVFGFDADLDGVRSLALLPLLPLVPVFPPSLL